MTKDTRSGKQGLRDEAADWFALMRGPEASDRRLEFEAWLGADPRHRDAYNRIGEAFSLGKGLKGPSETGGPAVADTAPPSVLLPAGKQTWRALATAAVLILGILGATTVLLRTLSPGNLSIVDAPNAVRQEIATSRGEIRRVTLADGSILTLDTDSSVSVSLSPTRRDLTLVRGRARFAVAHEARPFVVSAAGNLVTARGTLFDITLASQRTAVVDLIEGVVDVREHGRSAPGAANGQARGLPEKTTRLNAGQSLVLGVVQESRSPRPLARADWPDELRDFASVSLADLVAEANRYAKKPIVLASGDLAAIKVSGTFGVRDTHRLAGNLADLLGLALHEKSGTIVLGGQ